MKLVPALFAAAALLGTSAALAAPPAGSPSAQSPAQRCAAERTQMGTPAFKQLYGTNANRANAFGKCVSGKAEAASDTQERSTVNAAKTCRAEQTQDAAAFKSKYGTNANKSNAFGKCVSAHAKA